jgi:hypothetical protein
MVVPHVGRLSSPQVSQGSQQGSSLGSQYSPLVGSTHGTSGETGSVSTGIGTGFPGTGSGRAGTGTGSQGTVGQSSGVRSSGDDEEVPSGKRKPKWLQETLKEADDFGGPKRATRESRPPERFCAHMDMVTSITESEPSSYEEAASQQVWREAMVEEYASIMKNDV